MIHPDGPDRGYPLSWPHYVIGLRARNRHNAMRILQSLIATATPTMSQQDSGPLLTSVRRQAGLE